MASSSIRPASLALLSSGLARTCKLSLCIRVNLNLAYSHERERLPVSLPSPAKDKCRWHTGKMEV
jgi:hypothetical protein